MVKVRKNKSDAVYTKKANAKEPNPFASAIPATSKRWNPFEVHVNREKFQILGRTCKHDKGLPGVSRAKALKRRTETLGVEYQLKHKSNKFRDHRIGKHLNKDQLTESVMNARFLADKLSEMKQQNKFSKFNLNDDEVLTHRGQTLEEIEQFHDERSDDEEVDEVLDENFTKVANFGGEGAEDEKDRKSAIEEMITEQKRRKVEIAKEKDEIYELTAKLDANYKELLPLVAKATKNELIAKPSLDDFDRLLKELIFEPRGTVTDKLLSAEEVAEQERERLEKLEAERLKRMRADDEEEESAPQRYHRSADDLDDGYFAMDNNDGADNTLVYDLEGNLGGNKQAEQDGIANQNGSEEEDAGEKEEEEEESDEENEYEDADSDDGEPDNLSDLRVTDSELEQDENEKATGSKTKTKRTKQQVHTEDLDTDIPFTIVMPKTYEDFTKLLDKRKPVEKSTIIGRLIKCNHPKLDGVNREHVVKLFAFLMQYINELFADATQDDIALQFQILDALMPQLFELVHLNPERMSNTLLNVIKEKHAEYRKNPKMYPTLETVIYFKLVSNLYSTSDYRHPIATPTYIFMQHILSRARIRTRQDIGIGLFIVTLALEFAQKSKRFLPAAFNYLQGLIYLSIPKGGSGKEKAVPSDDILPPFESTGPMSKLLAIAKSKESKAVTEELLLSEDLVTTTFTLEFKIRALNMSLCLIKGSVELVDEQVSSNFLALPLLKQLIRLPLDAYPDFVKQNYDAAKSAVEQCVNKPLTRLAPPVKKPKALRLLEPRIEAVYDDKRRPKMSKVKEEKAKLLHKIKRETKGAMREIRRDTAYIQDLRIKQQIQSDKERHEKVKRIYQEASVQQGELNELARAKKRKKF